MGIIAAMAVILAAVAVWGCFLFRRRETAASAEADRLGTILRRQAALLGLADDQFCCWDPVTAAETMSPGMAPMIGLPAGTDFGFDKIAGIIDSGVRPDFQAQVDALRQDGKAFDRRFPVAGGRVLRIAGRTVPSRDGSAGVAVLFLRDVTVEDEAERRLRSDRDGLRALFDMLPLPVWRRSADLKTDYVNRAYEAAVEGDPERDGAVPEIAGHGATMARRAVDEATEQSETEHVIVGGERRLLEIHEAVLTPPNIVGGYALDLTELEETAAELKRHIRAHEDVLDNLGTAIAIYGADQRLSFFNTAFMRVWGLDEAWLRSGPDIGEVLEALRERRRLPEYADFPAFKRDTIKLFTSLIEPVEELVHLPDETTFRLVVTPHPFGGLLFTWEDVTDALALERSYNTLIDVQRETLDNLYEGIAVIAGDGRLRLWNPAFARIWQIDQEELAGEPHVTALVDRMREFFAESDDWTSQKEEIIALLTDRVARTGRLERADGSVLDYASVPLPDGAVLLSYVDVSDSIQVERALRERNEALETADRLKSEFIANVSYELRTPLNTIIGFAEILTDQYFGPLNNRQIEYSRGILESSQRLLSLINDILDLATIEAGHMTLELEPVDLHAMLSSVLALTRERAREKKLTMEFDCPSDIGRIVADERRIKQALFNILSNSIKFTPENGVIAVIARRTEDQVVLKFTDTGIGMSEDDRSRVFGKFERGSNPEARQSGAGLGLSLVKSFIELHGGHVELDSNQGQGTAVTCYFPAREIDTLSEQVARRAQA